MSKTIREELDGFRKTLADFRQLYNDDGTITKDEQDHLDSLTKRIEDLQLVIAVGLDGDEREANGFTAGPHDSATPTPAATGSDKGKRAKGDDTGMPQAQVVSSIVIYPENITLVAGGNESFSATADYADGTNEIVTNEVKWNTSAPDILSIDGHGQATAQSKKGPVKVTATLAGKTSNTATVDVVVLESIIVEPQQFQMKGGEKKQFNAMGVFTGNFRQRLDTSLNWTVSNPAVLDINKSTGAVTAKHVTDKAAVKVIDSTGRIGGSATVSVSTVQLKSLEIIPPNISLVVGVKQQIKVMGKFSEGPDQEETEAVRWETSHPSVITLDGKGGVTANAAVSGVTITVKDANNSKISAWAHVGMVENEVVSISIIPDAPTIPLGGFQQFAAWGDYADGSNRRLDQGVSWSSSNNDAVFMYPDGNTYARGSGNSTITAKYEFKDSRGMIGTIKDETEATVPSLQSITIEPANESIVVGGQLRFKVMGNYPGAPSGEVSGVTWSIAEKFASVNRDSGVVTGREPGVATLKAVHKNSSKEATIKVSITSQVLKSIRIDTDNIASFDGTIVRGQRRQFRAVGVYPLGSGKEETRPLASVSWSSDNEPAVSIDKDGLASALAVGKATIGAEDKNTQIETVIDIRVTESDSSSVTAADKNKVPPAVVKPYDAAKAEYQSLLATVRELDGIPKLIQSLQSIIQDVRKNADEKSVEKAQNAAGQQLQLEIIQQQVDNFKASVDSANSKIESTSSALQDFQGRQEVKNLREKGKEQQENIKFTLEAIKFSVSDKKDPAAWIEMVEALIERFEVDAYTKAAEALEKKLDSDKLKGIYKDIAQALSELRKAKGFLAGAKTLLDKSKKLFAVMRRAAEDHFDREADKDPKKKGSFRFSHINAPLDKANKIVNVLVPEAQKVAGISAAAITTYIDKQRVSKDSEPGRILFAMRDDAYGWRIQSNNVGKQTEALRKSLELTRSVADDALVYAQAK